MCLEINRSENYGPVPKVVRHSHQAKNPENLKPRIKLQGTNADEGTLVVIPLAGGGAAKTLVRRAPERLAS